MSDDDRTPPAAAIAQHLSALVPGLAVEWGPPSPAPSAGQAASVDDPTLVVPVDRLLETCDVLANDGALDFTLLVDIVGVDYLSREPRYEVVYHLVSIGRNQRLRLKVRIPSGDPHLASVTGVWPGAGFLEREVWDLFGIVFDGHGDLRRLLTPDDWEGHPLRKDYPVQIKLTPTSGQPLQMTEQEFRANIEADRQKRGGHGG